MSAMEGSMLIYSEKMKRISRQRLAQSSSMSPLPSKDKTLLPHRARENQPSQKNNDGTSMLRSFSDASKYKSLRDKRRQKKHSLDMTGSDLLKGGVGIDTNTPQDGRIISSAWETPNCLYKRERRRGVTVVPTLDSLNINENPLYLPDSSSDNGFSNVNHSLNKDLPLSTSDTQAPCSRTVRTDCPLERSVTEVLHNGDESEEGISEEIYQDNRITNPSQISQMVLESFSTDSCDLSVDLPSGFKDTSAAELKLLSHRRHRLSSSSEPSSPNESGDEDDDQIRTSRRRTQSESIHNLSKQLRSVLKKRTSFTKKQKPLEKRKTVTFISPDTIRVISRCSNYDTDLPGNDGACQSNNTIVVIRD